MTRPLRASGTSRTLLRTATATAALSAVSVLTCGIAPTAVADDTVRTVHQDGLGPNGPWLRLQETTPDREPGVQVVSPKPDPVHLNGSLRLAIAAGQQAQAAHYFNSTWTPEPMQPLLDAGVSYWAYTASEGSSVTNIGANLQFPASCGGFTTLSFEPGHNTDTQGAALEPDTWQKYRLTGDSVMRTSRAVAGIPAGGDAPLSHFVTACEGAYGVIANIGRLGDPNGTLNTYVDNITAKGTTWDFAVTGRASAALTVPTEIKAGDGPRPADASYTDPADGPEYQGIGTRLTLKGPAGLKPDQLTVMSEGSTVPLTQQADGSLTGELRTNLRAGATMEPGGKAGAAFTLAAAEGAPTGRLDVTAELTVAVDGTDGPVRTGVSATDHSRITDADTGHGPSPSPTHPHHPKPSPPGGGHGNGNWGDGHGKGQGKGQGNWVGGHGNGQGKGNWGDSHGDGGTSGGGTSGSHSNGGTSGGHSNGGTSDSGTGGSHSNGGTSDSGTGGSHGNGGAPLPNGPVDAGGGSTALTGSGSGGLSGPGLAIGAAGLLAAVAAAVGGLRTARRRRG
ncbi:hypothetical protein EES39_15145 [Streptomyces sp. ADI92-24]|uniref:hypothetical protein n=1 Tax=Streptomyces sp. ADI92-24 TaxID=1522756 RepID=UPI000F54F3EB|nr:hypothetical protein [Streptomyces sp. ADI92-24]RPK45456.1 hypothetical protein EES39_15145 [Streptomyces sp. ADI92-24]